MGEADIPTFACKPGCHACCGLVPFTTPERDRVAQLRPMERWEAFGDAWVTVSALATMRCPFLAGDGCGIYAHRPAVCRLFGAVDHPLMTCPHGCGPKRKFTETQSRRILAAAAIR